MNSTGNGYINLEKLASEGINREHALAVRKLLAEYDPSICQGDSFHPRITNLVVLVSPRVLRKMGVEIPKGSTAEDYFLDCVDSFLDQRKLLESATVQKMFSEKILAGAVESFYLRGLKRLEKIGSNGSVSQEELNNANVYYSKTWRDHRFSREQVEAELEKSLLALRNWSGYSIVSPSAQPKIETEQVVAKPQSITTSKVKPTQDGINLLWREFRQGSQEARNSLLEIYLPIVKYTAERLHAKLPDEVEVDDLISSGIFGLMDAVDAFDTKRGVKFETYCAPRIRGAILDELRAMDWVPRLVRKRSHKLGVAQVSLEAELGREPTREELAQKMKLSKHEFDKLERDAHAVGLVSLSRKWFETDSHKDFREIDILEDKRAEDPQRATLRKYLREEVTKGLSRAERLIVLLYYFEEMTMREIGETLDLSESRVSQMHTAVLGRLRSRLDSRMLEL